MSGFSSPSSKGDQTHDLGYNRPHLAPWLFLFFTSFHKELVCRRRTNQIPSVFLAISLLLP